MNTQATVRQLMDSIPDNPLPIIRRIMAEKSLKAFVQQAWHVVEQKKPLIWNWHLDAICNHLEAVTNTYIVRAGLHGKTIEGHYYEGDLSIPSINYLNINMPPRHTKSLLTSVFWPVCQ